MENSLPFYRSVNKILRTAGTETYQLSFFISNKYDHNKFITLLTKLIAQHSHIAKLLFLCAFRRTFTIETTSLMKLINLSEIRK
jgi:hypothetical protein